MDAHDNVLGTLVGLAQVGLAPYNNITAFKPNSVTVFKNGYFINVDFNGRIPTDSEASSAILWTGDNCTGTPYLSDQLGTAQGNLYHLPGGIEMGTKIVIYSSFANSFYVPSGDDASAVSVATPNIISVEPYENGSGCGHLEFGSASGWLLTPFDVASVLGWKLSGAPLGVAGPIKFR